MSTFSARVYPDTGDPYVIVTRPVDRVMWEKMTRRAVSEGMGETGTMQILHQAARREGLTDEPFEGWLAGIRDYEVVEEKDPSQPQQVQPSA